MFTPWQYCIIENERDYSMKFNIDKKEENILCATAKLVSINSVRDLETRGENAPFGKGIRQAMDCFTSIAKGWGFRVSDVDGYAVYAEIGPENDDHIGVLGHLDVVEAGDLNLWHSDPFHLDRRNGMLYGRGVNDDKGPLIAALWAARAVYETSEMNLPIRVIAGGAEETTWECMTHYFEHHPQPVMGFSPDGNFPIVNGEMGMIHVRLIFPKEPDFKAKSEVQFSYNCSDININGLRTKSNKVLSRNPQRSDHAVFNWINQYGFGGSFVLRTIHDLIQPDYHGKGLGIDSFHEEMGNCNVCILSLNSQDDDTVLDLDIRYPISTSEEIIINQLIKLGESYQFEVMPLKSRKPLYVASDHPLIKALKDAYQTVMHEEAHCITKGGASYARVMSAGVAFGATFEGEDPQPHMPNEKMPVSSLMKATDIYIESLKTLSSSQ